MSCPTSFVAPGVTDADLGIPTIGVGRRDGIAYFLDPNKHGDDSAERFGRGALAGLAPGASVLVAWPRDLETYVVLRHFQLIEGQRLDVTLDLMLFTGLPVRTVCWRSRRARRDADRSISRPTRSRPTPSRSSDVSSCITPEALHRPGPATGWRPPIPARSPSRSTEHSTNCCGRYADESEAGVPGFHRPATSRLSGSAGARPRTPGIVGRPGHRGHAGAIVMPTLRSLTSDMSQRW